MEPALHDFETLLDCFSEIDTELNTPERNRIAYLVQLLRLHEPAHLSETQRSGRRFVLDMLWFLRLLPDGQQAQADAVDVQDWKAPTAFKYLVHLLERTAQVALANRVRVCKGITSLDAHTLLQLREWLQHHGLDAHELALIQPRFFRDSVPTPHPASAGLHPHFATLSKESQERNHDYLTRAFFGMPQHLMHPPLGTQGGGSEVKPQAGLEEAMASIFDTPYDQKSATRTRLKAFFIPNRFGEPVIALSFSNE